MKVLFLILMLLAAAPSGAVEPDEMLKNPAQEARAREISRQLRCLVCQGEAIDDSSAEFAKDMRRLVRERIVAGDTDAEILAFLRDRYGDFILMEPPVSGKTALLWLTPFLLLGGGLILARRLSRAGL